MLGRGIILLLLTASSWAASFDKPLATKTVDLGPSKYSPGVRAQIRCYYFPGFMVKEVDLGEKGATRLAIIRNTHVVPKCSQTQYKSEMVVSPDEWSGYFMGVKNSCVFFSGEDGWNGAEPFAVFDAKSGKKLFEDVAKPFKSLDTRKADISFVTAPDQRVVMQYLRVVSDDCAILKDAACWQRMAGKYGLDAAAAPDCRKGYEASSEAMAKGRCQGKKGPLSACLEKERPLALKQALDSPSVISYPVEVELGATPSIKATGAATGCWEAD